MSNMDSDYTNYIFPKLNSMRIPPGTPQKKAKRASSITLLVHTSHLRALRSLQDLATCRIATHRVTRHALSPIHKRLTRDLELLGEVLLVPLIRPEACAARTVEAACARRYAGLGDVAEVGCWVEGIARHWADGGERLAREACVRAGWGCRD
jgi:hypothetical protein